MTGPHLRLATRRSPLALAQAEATAAALGALGVTSELVTTDTVGDLDLTASLERLGGQGVFVKEVQQLVLVGAADVAVHSAKDLPASTPSTLLLAAVPKRASAEDALVGRSLAGLGPGATVATGAPRRRALLQALRPDLHLIELRGNIATRLARLEDRHVDAVVMAVAALERLGQGDRIAEVLDPSSFTPQVGQGALALECRVDDLEARRLLAQLHDPASGHALTGERAFLAELGAGCSVPAGCHVVASEGAWFGRAVLQGADGRRLHRAEGRDEDPVALGQRLAEQVRSAREDHG